MSKSITIGHVGDNTILQKAVDDIAAVGGGVVEIPAGTYLMRDSLHLRSGVKIVGEAGTILLKAPSISVPLADFIGYGHYEFTATEPDKLSGGMGVTIADDNAFGFYETVATIIGRSGNAFIIDRVLNHDYLPDANGRVSTIFPIISGVGIRDASVENITIDGNPDETRTLNGCRGGGIFLLQSQNARIYSVEVKDYRGDAVSFQQCVDIVVSRCRLHRNTGNGLHPGSGSIRYVLEKNDIHDNGGCGIFYCLRTTHSICRDNRIERNGETGISIGERDTDHRITSNLIAENGRNGIEFRKPRFHGGDRVIVESNRLIKNCRTGGEHEICLDSNLHDISIVRNEIEPGTGSALFVGSGCTGIGFSENKIDRRNQTGEDIAGDRRAVTSTKTVPLRPLAPDGARHLGIEELPPCPDD